jgi:hypothetical protein
MYWAILIVASIPVVAFIPFFAYLFVVAKKIRSGTITGDPFLPLRPWLHWSGIVLSALIAAELALYALLRWG